MSGIRRIFYDKLTGDKIHEIGRNGSFTLPTIDQDIATFTALSERNRDTFDVLELEFDQYKKDFEECNGYWVNVEKLASLTEENRHEALEFSYPDPNAPEAPSVLRKPLSVEIEELRQRDASMQDDQIFIMEVLVANNLL